MNASAERALDEKLSRNNGPHQVFLGRLDWANPACRYAFPTAMAAQVFALASKCRHEERRVVVTDPDGGIAVMEIDGVHPMDTSTDE
jgi:hypothetical protein